jgi:hypothetical protein
VEDFFSSEGRDLSTAPVPGDDTPFEVYGEYRGVGAL